MNGTKKRVKPDLARRQLWYVVRQAGSSSWSFFRSEFCDRTCPRRGGRLMPTFALPRTSDIGGSDHA